MNELLDQLGRLAGPAPEVGDATVAADLRRGQVARRRRRIVRSAGTGVAALAVAGVATAVAVSGQGGASAPVAGHHTTRTSTAPGIRLADYTGAQLPGFEVAKVPDGFVLQGASSGVLDIARAGDHSSLDSFVGKLVVTVEANSIDTRGQQVDVGGHVGYLRHQEGNTMLEYSDGTHDVDVQSWGTLGLTDQQVVEFAEGITVTAAVTESHG